MFDWSDYLTLARDLRKTKGEAFKRTVISRAYYSVYRRADNYLKEKNLPLAPSRDKHSAVWLAFSKIQPNGSKISIVGDRLKHKRVQADYKDTYAKDLGKEAELALKDADEIERLLQELT